MACRPGFETYDIRECEDRSVDLPADVDVCVLRVDQLPNVLLVLLELMLHVHLQEKDTVSNTHSAACVCAWPTAS